MNSKHIQAIIDSITLILMHDKFDTLVFRKKALKDVSLHDQKILLSLSQYVLTAHPILLAITKSHVDEFEFQSDFYKLNSKTRGCYFPIAKQFLAGLAAATM